MFEMRRLQEYMLSKTFVTRFFSNLIAKLGSSIVLLRKINETLCFSNLFFNKQTYPLNHDNLCNVFCNLFYENPIAKSKPALKRKVFPEQFLLLPMSLNVKRFWNV